MKSFDVVIEGIQPLLMHSPQGVDPTHPLVLRMKEITSKPAKKRTDAERAEMDWIEFQLGLYWNDKFVYVPDDAIMGAIVAGAKASRRGQETLAGVDTEQAHIPLVYKGPTTPKALYDAKFVDRRPAGIQKARVMRTRPRFNAWGLKFTLNIADDIVSPEHIKEALTVAGSYKGLLDYRPRFGRFKVTTWKVAA